MRSICSVEIWLNDSFWLAASYAGIHLSGLCSDFVRSFRFHIFTVDFSGGSCMGYQSWDTRATKGCLWQPHQRESNGLRCEVGHRRYGNNQWHLNPPTLSQTDVDVQAWRSSCWSLGWRRVRDKELVQCDTDNVNSPPPTTSFHPCCKLSRSYLLPPPFPPGFIRESFSMFDEGFSSLH